MKILHLICTNGISGAEKNLNFLLPELLAEKDLPALLNYLDIYVHASFVETMSTAIMQAMAFGKGIVASNVAGINNMITNKQDGILVSIQKPEEMAEAIEKIILNLEYKLHLEENALAIAKNKFRDFKMFLSYKAIFNKV